MKSEKNNENSSLSKHYTNAHTYYACFSLMLKRLKHTWFMIQLQDTCNKQGIIKRGYRSLFLSPVLLACESHILCSTEFSFQQPVTRCEVCFPGSWKMQVWTCEFLSEYFSLQSLKSLIPLPLPPFSYFFFFLIKIVSQFSTAKDTNWNLDLEGKFEAVNPSLRQVSNLRLQENT